MFKESDSTIDILEQAEFTLLFLLARNLFSYDLRKNPVAEGNRFWVKGFYEMFWSFKILLSELSKQLIKFLDDLYWIKQFFGSIIEF